MSLFERQMGHVGRYRIIVADPPWPHQNYGQAQHGAAKSAYDEMPLEDLERMPVGELAHPAGALLLMWCTGPQAADGAHRRLAEAWGFRLSTRAFAWVKTNRACEACRHDVDDHDMPTTSGRFSAGECCEDGCPCAAFAASADFGPGSYTGGNIEDVWLGVREGDTAWSARRARRDIRQVILAASASKHSQKPEALQDRLEALWPWVAPGERLELFARRRRTGWACWGGQCPEPDLVFGDPPGAWWPLAPRAEVAASPASVPMFSEGP